MPNIQLTKVPEFARISPMKNEHQKDNGYSIVVKSSRLDASVIEKHYGAKFVFSSSIMGKNGWTPDAFLIFYTEHVDFHKGHRHYFAVGLRDEKLIITSAEVLENHKIVGITIDSRKEFYYSATRHDYVEVLDDQGVQHFIDGGREYTRATLYSPLAVLSLTPKGPRLMWADGEILPLKGF